MIVLHAVFSSITPSSTTCSVAMLAAGHPPVRAPLVTDRPTEITDDPMVGVMCDIADVTQTRRTTTHIDTRQSALDPLGYGTYPLGDRLLNVRPSTLW